MSCSSKNDLEVPEGSLDGRDGRNDWAALNRAFKEISKRYGKEVNSFRGRIRGRLDRLDQHQAASAPTSLPCGPGFPLHLLPLSILSLRLSSPG